MKKLLGKLPDSLVRIIVVFLVIVGGVLAIRALLPDEVTNTEAHIASTIAAEDAKEPKFAGSGVCEDCHTESAIKKTGYHSLLSCETCHGASKAHTEDPTETKPVAPRKREFCSLCHTYDPSRPTGFPQINPVAHNPLKPCILCHNPHDPKPSTVPTDCDACHGEIARTKSISPHVQLKCTECHNVPRDHKVRPRNVRATIPTERAFCGKCHSQDAKVAGIPRVDLSTHGEKYLCWQCHYPHMPEVVYE